MYSAMIQFAGSRCDRCSCCVVVDDDAARYTHMHTLTCAARILAMSHPSHDPIARLLAEHQDFFKLAFERSRGTIVVSRHAPFDVLDLNPKAAKTCNVDASAVRGAPLFSAIPALDHHSVRELFELSKDNPQAAVVTINHKPIRVRTR